MRNCIVEEITCKTILNKTPAGFADYTLNPYTGCAFGCVFCYVPALRARRGQNGVEEWGQYVQVKTNAVEALRQQLPKLRRDAKIMFGTATDPWQPIEKQYRITRGLLEALAPYPNPLSIVTRSPLIMRDIDLLAARPRLSLNFSLGTFDEKVRRHFEPHAPGIPGRVVAIKKLVEAGVKVGTFFAPILPGVTDNEAAVRDYFRQVADLGVCRVMCDLLNYRDQVGEPVQRRVGDFVRLGLGDGSRLPRGRLAQTIREAAAEHGVNVVVGFNVMPVRV